MMTQLAWHGDCGDSIYRSRTVPHAQPNLLCVQLHKGAQPGIQGIRHEVFKHGQAALFGASASYVRPDGTAAGIMT
eukprot:SAG31_NODE_28345_length_411_cov_1.118590_1_plen_75_part_10